MASMWRKIIGRTPTLTATLSQTRRSIGKYRNIEYSAGRPCKIFNNINSIIPRAAPAGSPCKIFNRIDSIIPRAAPQQGNHRFFHDTTNNVKKNSEDNANESSILELGDEERLFSGVATEDLIDSLFRLNLIACQHMAVSTSKFECYKSYIIKMAHAHFCAGETLGVVSQELHRIRDLGLKGILNYTVEGAPDNNVACDSNLNHILDTISSLCLLPPGSVRFFCVKMTGICPPTLLERVSQLIVKWQQRYPGFNFPWEKENLPILGTDEETDLNLAEQRLFRLCGACEAASLPLLVDAEYTIVQPAIDYLVYRAFSNFNKIPGKAVVYGTVQAYLKDSLPRVIAASEEAKKRGITLGVKLVRGAYMRLEKEMAKSLCVPSPLHSSIRETHSCYNACASLLLEKVAKGEASLLLATHNVKSARMAVAKAEELDIGKRECGLQFAQLKGMADCLSLGLCRAGFDVSKYLPFGPIENAIPYLNRRGEENKDMIITKHPDLELIRKEFHRRLKTFSNEFLENPESFPSI